MSHYLNLLPFRPMSHLAIDPGINCTGFSVYKHTSDKGAGRKNKCYRNLVHYGSICPATENKVLEIKDQLLEICRHWKPDYVCFEHPPETCYEQKFLDKDGIIARMQSVFKTIAVLYTMLGSLPASLRTHFLYPRDWQLHHSKRGGLDTKQWSLQRANEISSGKLRTTKDENIADAICIGYKFLDLLEEGLEVPV